MWRLMEPKTSAIPDSFLSRRKKNHELNIISFGRQASNCIAIARFRSTSFFRQSRWNVIFFFRTMSLEEELMTRRVQVSTGIYCTSSLCFHFIFVTLASYRRLLYQRVSHKRHDLSAFHLQLSQINPRPSINHCKIEPAARNVFLFTSL